MSTQEVERILRYSYHNGKKCYRVKFKDCDKSHTVWLTADAVPQDMRDAYHFKYTSKNRKRKTTVFKHTK